MPKSFLNLNFSFTGEDLNFKKARMAVVMARPAKGTAGVTGIVLRRAKLPLNQRTTKRA